MITVPRILIAGTQSGVGKTTVAVGIMAALARRGIMVQPFKVGPDYIDPTYHAAATGRVSRNLDTWLLTPRLVRGIFQRVGAGAGIAVIEGVMGLFDGHGSTADRGSTAEVAKLLQAPVILVIDGSHLARSAAAMVQGYRAFDRAVRVAGVIVNKVSERHFQLLRESLRRYTAIPVLGYLPHEAGCSIPERHLGLVPAQEDRGLAQTAERLAAVVSRTVRLDELVRIARAAPPLAPAHWPIEARDERPARVTIGLARDPAFHFYYEENLELLRALGAELVEFSPLQAARLPDALDGLYLGGGFPEIFAERLARNVSLRREIRRAVGLGLPTYAECGGLMYLAERIADAEGKAHAMVGALPGSIRMTNRLQHFGYATLIPRRNSILAKARDSIKGHEFHYSIWDHQVPPSQAAYTVVQRRGERRLEGFARANLLASYVHVHFLTNVRWARGFVASAERWKAHRAAELGAVRKGVVAGSMPGSLSKAGAAPQL